MQKFYKIIAECLIVDKDHVQLAIDAALLSCNMRLVEKQSSSLIEEQQPENYMRSIFGDKVYLTGSRYFGTDTPESDWDFFVQDTPANRLALMQYGFSIIANSHYLDCNTCFVYGKNKIHVQLVHDVALKRKAQLLLSRTPIEVSKKKDRSVVRMTWERAFDTVNKIDAIDKPSGG